MFNGIHSIPYGLVFPFDAGGFADIFRERRSRIAVNRMSCAIFTELWQYARNARYGGIIGNSINLMDIQMAVYCPFCAKKARVLHTLRVKKELIEPGKLMALLWCQCSDLVECGASFAMNHHLYNISQPSMIDGGDHAG